MRRPLVLCIAVLTAGLGAAPAVAATTAAGPPARTWRSGVFAGYGPSGDLAFARWRDAPIQTATDFIGEDNWSQIEDPSWDIAQWATARQVQPVFSIPLWPAFGGGDFADAASGAYNAHFVAMARSLVAGGLGSAELRIGWEFNGTWYRWSVTTRQQAAQYAAAWRQIVTAIRTVKGEHFSFDWDPTQGDPSGVNAALSYPGNAYVTDIGEDVYDWDTTPYETFTQRWNALVDDPDGLAWQARFAKAHRKPIAFPEWGLVADLLAPQNAGGDDPGFIDNMYTWFASHDTAFEDYFDSDPTLGIYYALSTGSGWFPHATAAYLSLF